MFLVQLHFSERNLETQGHMDAIGTYNELQSSGVDFQKTIVEEDFETDHVGISFSESENEVSILRYRSVSCSLQNRRGSSVSRISATEVNILTYTPFISQLIDFPIQPFVFFLIIERNRKEILFC